LFRYRKELPVQGYTLNILPGQLTVEYSNRQGLYYALVSLKVLKINYSGTIPCVYLEDFPDLAERGMMLDISRNKVPKPETLMGIVSLLADLKYNHFELYIEGFSFAYPSFKNLWEGKETPVTGEEIQQLDTFCRAHFIDLVPNQNSFGHMMAWLATEQFADLAECPDGYKIFGLMEMKGTLDPNDPRSVELVTRMTDDLLPNFTSAYYNVNLDEPLELGKGKSKDEVQESGLASVYLDYAMKIHDLVTNRNKKMLMWGDIILRHPDVIRQLPKDITLLDWGYESSYPFDRNCKTLQSSGLRYMVCPGTSSWTSILGRTENMLGNIKAAASSGVKYGAAGLLLTDWGDMGHWQYLPVSYAGYLAGGALSWNSNNPDKLPLAEFLNRYVFMDAESVMGALVLDLGLYNRFEDIPVPNMTTTMLALQFGMRNRIMSDAILDKLTGGMKEMIKDLSPELVAFYDEKLKISHLFDYKGLFGFLDAKEDLLSRARMQTTDSQLIYDEYRNAIRLVRLGAGLQYYTDYSESMELQEKKAKLEELRNLLHQYLDENKRLWLIRNKAGGYDRSTAVLVTLGQQLDKKLEILNSSSFRRGIDRFLEKMTTAAAVLYLKTT
jgi:hypothetical protein